MMDLIYPSNVYDRIVAVMGFSKHFPSLRNIVCMTFVAQEGWEFLSSVTLPKNAYTTGYGGSFRPHCNDVFYFDK